MPKCIYIADDEAHIRSLMKTFLENEGYAVSTFSDGYGIKRAVEEKCPDLIILDIMMPGEDGLSVCASIRKKSMVPIIIVSAKDSPLDRVTGITLGSDDYMVKPFLPLELVARVKALFRRAEISRAQNSGGHMTEAGERKNYSCGDMTLDPQARKVTLGSQAFAVTPIEFDFLLYMLERKDTAVSKKELLEQVWKCQDSINDTRMTDDLVKRLRKKIRERDSRAVIETVWGYGYRVTERQEVFNG